MHTTQIDPAISALLPEQALRDGLSPATNNPDTDADHQADVDVLKGVRRYCRRIGLDTSNTQGAIATAIRSGGCTVVRIQAGRIRADVLRARQTRHHPALSGEPA